MQSVIVIALLLASATGLICRAVGSIQAEQSTYTARLDSRIAQEAR